MLHEGGLGFVFPGQGSQSVGMLSQYVTFPTYRETIEQASDFLGYNLIDLIAQGPDVELNATDKTQPAILSASVALYRLWHEYGGRKPDLLAGHSLGEYTALVVAESLAFSDAVKLVQMRGEMMQSAAPAGLGAMAAVIGLDAFKIQEICQHLSTPDFYVSAANYNSPEQTVIAGHQAAVEVVMTHCKEAGAKRVLMLSVSVPSHTVLMDAMQKDFQEALASIDVKMPLIPVLHNVNAGVVTNVQDLRSSLVQQLSHPVQWVKVMGAMRSSGISHMIECGPGRALMGLSKRCEPNIVATALDGVDFPSTVAAWQK